MNECKECKKEIIVTSNAKKYCEKCAKKIIKRNNLARKRKQRKIPQGKPVGRWLYPQKNKTLGTVSKNGTSIYRPPKWAPLKGRKIRREHILNTNPAPYDSIDIDFAEIDEKENEYWNEHYGELGKDFEKTVENTESPYEVQKMLDNIGKPKYRSALLAEEREWKKKFYEDMELLKHLDKGSKEYKKIWRKRAKDLDRMHKNS